MPISLVTESKDVEMGEGDSEVKIKAGTWEFYHFHSTKIHLHVQPIQTTAAPTGEVGKVSINCYSRKTDRDVKYFFDKFLQRTMDEKSEAISNTKCVGNARLD